MRPRISIRGSVRPSVGRLVGNAFFLNTENEGFSFLMSSGRPGKWEHHRNLELHLYKVCLLVHPSVNYVEKRTKGRIY